MGRQEKSRAGGTVPCAFQGVIKQEEVPPPLLTQGPQAELSLLEAGLRFCSRCVRSALLGPSLPGHSPHRSILPFSGSTHTVGPLPVTTVSEVSPLSPGGNHLPEP